MNLSYNWFSEYLKSDFSPLEISKALTSLGLEVGNIKEIESIKGGLKGLVVGKVLTCIVHENSDHLHVTTVDIGGESPLQIVCGAPNISAGQTVIVATIGTSLYSDDEEFKIKKTKIRGIESFGMICSAKEIGVGSSHEGIMELDNDIKAGTLAKDLFNVSNDYLIEVDITPNRVEAASHYGSARDIAAYLKQNKIPYTLKKPDVSKFNFTQNGVEKIKIKIEDTTACPRYAGVYIEGVEVKESPEWLQNRLITIGLRPINNIVDITNFVLHELGHPLHAYDADEIEGNEIIVKTLPTDTPFTTLDGIERKLDENDLMICNTQKPMCIAGVFGGLNSGVTNKTKNVFLECAYFNPTSIRKTARRHSLNTDSSFRFERGADPNDIAFVLKRATLLIQDVAGGEVIGNLQDVYPKIIPNAEVVISYEKINGLIGKAIDKETIKSILESLEIKIIDEDDSELKLNIPSYRVDVLRDVDVIEEILRVYGYNNVETSSFVKSNLSVKSDTDYSYELQNTISHTLTGVGFYEILNNSLSKENYYQDLNIFPSNKNVKIINALSADLNVMRQTLLFGGLESILYNINRRISGIKFFEFGNCYQLNDLSNESDKSKESKDILHKYQEKLNLALWLYGQENENSWNFANRPVSFFDLKAYVENILNKLNLKGKYVFETTTNDLFSNAVLLKVKNKEAGILGNVANSIKQKFDISGDVFFAELNWTLLMKSAKKEKVIFREISKFPGVERDFALLLNKDVEFSKIEQIAYKADRKLVKDVKLFDVYEGKNLPEGKKSYAVKFYLQDEEKTLTDKQIDAVMQKIYKSLEKEIEVQLR